jgi:hypothetical protein
MFGWDEKRRDWRYGDHAQREQLARGYTDLSGSNNGGWGGSGPSRSNTVRLGLNYHFNSGGAAPIYAKQSWLRLSEQRPAEVKWIPAGLC